MEGQVPGALLRRDARPLEERSERFGTFTFVDDLEHAIQLAKAAAGRKDVRVMGAELARQSLEAGLVDEIGIQLVPVLLDFRVVK